MLTWIQESGTLGIVTGSRTRAKELLVQWGRTLSNPPIADYGATDLDKSGYWTGRDQTMLDAFVDSWTGMPRAFKQPIGDSPSKSEVDALEAWSQSGGQVVVSAATAPIFPAATPVPACAVCASGAIANANQEPECLALPEGAGKDACLQYYAQFYQFLNCRDVCAIAVAPTKPASWGVPITTTTTPAPTGAKASSNTGLIIAGVALVGLIAVAALSAARGEM